MKRVAMTSVMTVVALAGLTITGGKRYTVLPCTVLLGMMFETKSRTGLPRCLPSGQNTIIFCPFSDSFRAR